MLKFSKANAKIEALSKVPELAKYLEGKRKVYSFDLLSGYSCPFAEQCLSKATVQLDGKRKIKDGPKTEFRCFSASQEVQYTNVYKLRKGNFDAIRKHKTAWDMCKDLTLNLPKDAGIVRIHVAGDFFNENYFKAWMMVANLCPSVLFYAYTKSLKYWIDNRDLIPDNLILTASRGGRLDHLIDEHNLREAVVVYSEFSAAIKKLIIDHDDSHAACPSLKDNSFALLIHGTQPKGTEAANALQNLRRNKVKHSYSRKKLEKI
jgi:hypothetical protein|tara:strand:- start:12 stop:797 length:786 start_codon:yes stop_codon:yes gene_type:complete